MRAMILAAGYGTRLFPLTVDRAKPALPFLGRPLVGYVAAYLGEHGFTDVLVNLHHESDSIRGALGDGSKFGTNIHYIDEPEILGTSGALDNARAFLESGTFLVINGKIVTDINLRQALETHRRTGALATLILRPNPKSERFSIVETDGELVKGFGGMPEKPNESDNVGSTIDSSQNIRNAPLMFTGIQILEPRIFNYIPRNVFSHSTTDVYPQAIARGEKIVAHMAHEAWYEMSTIPRYLEISLAVLAREGKSIFAGVGCRIEPSAHVNDAILWNNVRIGARAKLRRVVLGDGVEIGEDQTLENVAVVRAALVEGIERPAKALPGEVRGSNFVVPLPE